jgi:type I restriction enzyme M protein
VLANPLNDADLADFIDRQKTFADSPKSWSVDVKDIDPKTCDLSVINPDRSEVIAFCSPAEIVKEIAKLDSESTNCLVCQRCCEVRKLKKWKE